jgi:hypothetical protein
MSINKDDKSIVIEVSETATLPEGTTVTQELMDQLEHELAWKTMLKLGFIYDVESKTWRES